MQLVAIKPQRVDNIRESGLQFRSQYGLSEEASEVLEYVPRVDSPRACLKTQDLVMRNYRLGKYVHIITKRIGQITNSYFGVHKPCDVSYQEGKKMEEDAYQPMKGDAVYWTPPISNPSLVNAGKATHFKSSLSNSVTYLGCRILISFRRSAGSSIMAGPSSSAMATSGKRSHRPLGSGGCHPRSSIALVTSTLVGSPKMVPQPVSYPANWRT